jgi:hypothetical protein
MEKKLSIAARNAHAILKLTKPGDVVATDVDGVLGDFVGACFRAVGMDGKLKLEHVTTWDGVFTLLSVADRNHLKNVIMQDGRFWRERIRVIEGTAAMLQILRDAGRIIYAVSSPWHSCETWEHARRGWLERNFKIGKDHFAPLGSEVKPRFRADVLIEDSDTTLVKWLELNPSGIGVLIDAPYNRSCALRLGHPSFHVAQNPQLAYAPDDISPAFATDPSET